MTLCGSPSNGRLSVLMVAAPGSVGGLERVVQSLSSGLRRTGHEAQVAAVLDDGVGTTPFLTGLARAAVPVHPIILAPRAYLSERRRLAELFHTLAPDLIHTHGYRADVQAGAVARRLGLPTVTTVHGFTEGGWKNRIYERVQRRSFRKFDAVVAVSRNLGERLKADGVSPERIHVLPNAAPAGDARPLSRDDARRRLGVPEGAFVAGWVGRLSYEKAPDLMVEALALVPPCIQAVIIGDGTARAQTQALAQARGVAPRIRWVGTLPDAASLFSAFDCFVLSSRTEGTPMVVFEAMAAGVPIVARSVGGVPDMISEREAVLVRSTNPAELAGGIATVYADPAVAEARASAALRRLAMHQPGPWVARYEKLYRDVLASPRAGSSA